MYGLHPTLPSPGPPRAGNNARRPRRRRGNEPHPAAPNVAALSTRMRLGHDGLRPPRHGRNLKASSIGARVVPAPEGMSRSKGVVRSRPNATRSRLDVQTLLLPRYQIRPVVVTVCHNRHNGVPRIYCACFRLFPVVFSYQEAAGLTIGTTFSAHGRHLRLVP